MKDIIRNFDWRNIPRTRKKARNIWMHFRETTAPDSDDESHEIAAQSIRMITKIDRNRIIIRNEGEPVNDCLDQDSELMNVRNLETEDDTKAIESSDLGDDCECRELTEE